jgi:hypothetical protein
MDYYSVLSTYQPHAHMQYVNNQCFISLKFAYFLPDRERSPKPGHYSEDGMIAVARKMTGPNPGHRISRDLITG